MAQISLAERNALFGRPTAEEDKPVASPPSIFAGNVPTGHISSAQRRAMLLTPRIGDDNLEVGAWSLGPGGIPRGVGKRFGEIFGHGVVGIGRLTQIEMMQRHGGDIIDTFGDAYAYKHDPTTSLETGKREAKKAKIKKFVYAASASCYGKTKNIVGENTKISLEHPYALSKYLGEKAVFHWHKVYGLPVNSIRIFNAYGPRVRTTGAYGAVIGVFLKQKIEAK